MGEAVKAAKSIIDNVLNPKFTHGIKAGCVICGEIRALFPDGELNIIHAGKHNNTNQ